MCLVFKLKVFELGGRLMKVVISLFGAVRLFLSVFFEKNDLLLKFFRFSIEVTILIINLKRLFPISMHG